MTKRGTALALGAVLFGVMPTIGCGSNRVGAPTAPAAALDSPVAASLGAADAGARLSAQETTPSNVVSSLVAGTSCPTLQLKISTYVIRTDARTLYSGGTCASIQAGTRVLVAATRTSESDPTVYATQVTIVASTTAPTPPTTEPKPPTTPPASVPVSGEAIITSVVATTSCPALTFMLGTYPVSTNASTHFENGTCASLRAGVKVAVTGTKAGDAIVATNVAVRELSGTPAPKPEPTAPTAPVSGEAIITSVVTTTSCPALTFMLGTYTVSANSSTHFENGTCASLKAGLKVAITGTKIGDTIVATNIAVRELAGTPAPKPGEPTAPKTPEREAEGEGVVTSVTAGTACPTLQFMIGSYTIKLGEATQYLAGACADLKVGSKVGVKGTVAADGSVSASAIAVRGETPKP